MTNQYDVLQLTGIVGWDVGFLVGALEGAAVGWGVGTSVGFEVGTDVGGGGGLLPQDPNTFVSEPPNDPPLATSTPPYLTL